MIGHFQNKEDYKLKESVKQQRCRAKLLEKVRNFKLTQQGKLFSQKNLSELAEINNHNEMLLKAAYQMRKQEIQKEKRNHLNNRLRNSLSSTPQHLAFQTLNLPRDSNYSAQANLKRLRDIYTNPSLSPNNATFESSLPLRHYLSQKTPSQKKSISSVFSFQPSLSNEDAFHFANFQQSRNKLGLLSAPGSAPTSLKPKAYCNMKRVPYHQQNKKIQNKIQEIDAKNTKYSSGKKSIKSIPVQEAKTFNTNSDLQFPGEEKSQILNQAQKQLGQKTYSMDSSSEKYKFSPQEGLPETDSPKASTLKRSSGKFLSINAEKANLIPVSSDLKRRTTPARINLMSASSKSHKSGKKNIFLATSPNLGLYLKGEGKQNSKKPELPLEKNNKLKEVIFSNQPNPGHQYKKSKIKSNLSLIKTGEKEVELDKTKNKKESEKEKDDHEESLDVVEPSLKMSTTVNDAFGGMDMTWNESMVKRDKMEHLSFTNESIQEFNQDNSEIVLQKSYMLSNQSSPTHKHTHKKHSQDYHKMIKYLKESKTIPLIELNSNKHNPPPLPLHPKSKTSTPYTAAAAGGSSGSGGIKGTQQYSRKAVFSKTEGSPFFPIKQTPVLQMKFEKVRLQKEHERMRSTLNTLNKASQHYGENQNDDNLIRLNAKTFEQNALNSARSNKERDVIDLTNSKSHACIHKQSNCHANSGNASCACGSGGGNQEGKYCYLSKRKFKIQEQIQKEKVKKHKQEMLKKELFNNILKLQQSETQKFDKFRLDAKSKTKNSDSGDKLESSSAVKLGSVTFIVGENATGVEPSKKNDGTIQLTSKNIKDKIYKDYNKKFNPPLKYSASEKPLALIPKTTQIVDTKKFTYSKSNKLIQTQGMIYKEPPAPPPKQICRDHILYSKPESSAQSANSSVSPTNMYSFSSVKHKHVMFSKLESKLQVRKANAAQSAALFKLGDDSECSPFTECYQTKKGNNFQTQNEKAIVNKSPQNENIDSVEEKNTKEIESIFVKREEIISNMNSTSININLHVRPLDNENISRQMLKRNMYSRESIQSFPVNDNYQSKKR